jgi:hypothetical protein
MVGRLLELFWPRADHKEPITHRMYPWWATISLDKMAELEQSGQL